MIRALLFGATGYTGIELIRILSGHPDAHIIGGSSRDWAGKKASDILPFIAKDHDFSLYSLGDLVSKSADVAFLALPHGEAAQVIRPLLQAGLKVVDLSADSRLKNPETYQEWYGAEHKDPELLSKAVYGLPELNRAHIQDSELVANPGCYPTTVILGIAPALQIKEVGTDCPIVDAKSGISGAGRGAKITTSFCEAGEGFKPYGVIGHRHIPEMEQELSFLAGKQIKVRFTPHLIPVSRGMVSTIYLPLNHDLDDDALRKTYRNFYRREPFVKIMPTGIFPDTSRIRGSNQCHISVEVDQRTGWMIVMSAIDNLVKGASGTAVQNMNLMMGVSETSGLESLPLFP